jgi:hypothetical protein
MRMPFSRGWNAGNLLVGLGLVALGFLLTTPYAGAARTARVELRAAETMLALRDIIRAAAQLDLGPAGATALLPALHARLAHLEHPPGTYPEAVAGEPGALRFASKHYCFQVAPTPLPEYQSAESQPATQAFEVHAWPMSAIGPGHAAFFCATDAEPAFTRNLDAGYVGFEQPPIPGRTRTRGDPPVEPDQDWYRGRDDERWILLPRDPRARQR